MMNKTTERIRHRPKVFIINRGCHNFSAAERFGDLVFMTEGMVSRYAVGEIYRAFEEHLTSSTPDDYLLVSGMSTMLIVASGMLTQKHGCLNLLLYKNGRYLKRHIKLDNGEANHE